MQANTSCNCPISYDLVSYSYFATITRLNQDFHCPNSFNEKAECEPSDTFYSFYGMDARSKKFVKSRSQLAVVYGGQNGRNVRCL